MVVLPWHCGFPTHLPRIAPEICLAGFLAAGSCACAEVLWYTGPITVCYEEDQVSDFGP
jgi:hypothetical protein